MNEDMVYEGIRKVIVIVFTARHGGSPALLVLCLQRYLLALHLEVVGGGRIKAEIRVMLWLVSLGALLLFTTLMQLDITIINEVKRKGPGLHIRRSTNIGSR